MVEEKLTKALAKALGKTMMEDEEFRKKIGLEPLIESPDPKILLQYFISLYLH